MSTISIIAGYNAPARGPAGLAWDGRTLWNADFSTAKIFGLDVERMAATRTLICPGSLSGLAWDGRALWQVLHMDGWLRRIDPATNDFDHTLAVADHGWLSGAAWDGRHLWVVSQQKGRLFALDSDNGQIVHSLPAPLAGGGLAYHDGSLWLAYPDAMTFNEVDHCFDWQSRDERFALVRLDPADGRAQARYSLDFLAMGLAWVHDELWLTHAGAGKLYHARLGST